MQPEVLAEQIHAAMSWMLDVPNSSYFYAIILIIALGFAATQLTRREQSALTVADIGVCLFTITQLASCRFGIYIANAQHYGLVVACAACVYLALRLQRSADSKTLRFIAGLTCIFGLCFSWVNISLLVQRYYEWKSLKLEDLISLRQCFYLIGGNSKIEAATIGLVISGYSLITLSRESRWHLKALALLSFVGCSAVTVLSLSKGVFLGYLALCLSILFFARLFKVPLQWSIKGSLLGAITLSAVAVLVIYVRPAGSRHGIQISSQVLQLRSVRGRMHIWGATTTSIRGHILFGVGGDNVALNNLAHPIPGSSDLLVSRSYNWLIQIFLQNGLAGLLLACLIGISSATVALRRCLDITSTADARRVSIIVVATLIALLVSDATYTSMVSCPIVMFAFMALLGSIHASHTTYRHKARWWRVAGTPSAYAVSLVFLATNAYFLAGGLREERAEDKYGDAYAALQGGDYDQAANNVRAAEDQADCNALFLSMEGLIDVRQAESAGGDEYGAVHVGGSLMGAGRVQLTRAIDAYERASSCAPMDPMIQNNLAWLYATLGNATASRLHINRALTIEPDTALYRVSSGLLYENGDNIQDAAAEYARAVAISPKLLYSRFFYELSTRNKTFVAAILTKSKALVAEMPDRLIADARAASIALYEGDVSESRFALGRVLDKYPGLSYGWLNLGMLQEHTGDIAGSIVSYRQASFIDPENRWALINLARVDYVGADYQEGFNAVERAAMLRDVSEHYVRSLRMYRMQPLATNDVVPGWLLGSLQPMMDSDNFCKIAYQLAQEDGHEVPPWLGERIAEMGGRCQPWMQDSPTPTN